MRLEIPEQGGNSDSESLIKSDPPKGKATPQATGNRIRTGNGTNESLVKLETPERENAKAEDLESENCLTRFDRESDTKESDRVGNARQQDTAGKRREAPGGPR
ncbi:hypothetical protein, partial [Streptomyces sp. NPDC048142]|uniref:hypothetical protein n=1 Tax=Streptomyces sp. NPDC048142 TaxID=3365501 RepID=UPI00371D3E1D